MPQDTKLAPGELPNITDTDPPPLHASTVILPGEVRIVDPPLTAQEIDAIEAARATAKPKPKPEPVKAAELVKAAEPVKAKDPEPIKAKPSGGPGQQFPTPDKAP